MADDSKGKAKPIAEKTIAARKTSRRTEGMTPNGGVASVIYFRDDDGNPTAEDRATQGEIVEFGKDGEDVGRTHVNLKRPGNST